MKYNEVVKELEHILSTSKITLMGIIDLRQFSASEMPELPTGKYFVCDLRVPIPISQDK